MIHSTRGIVLRIVDYSDTSLIVSVYTEKFGVQSYLVKGAKRKKSTLRPALLQPLTLLEMEVYQKEGKHLQTLKEIRPEVHLPSLTADPMKMSVAIFLHEVLVICLREEEPNQDLFSFLHETIVNLDHLESGYLDLHLVFLIRLSRFLGFYPQGLYDASTPFFDLREGKFLPACPHHPDYISAPESEWIGRIIRSSYFSLPEMNFTTAQRRTLLSILLQYYQLHLSGSVRFRSPSVLEQLFV